MAERAIDIYKLDLQVKGEERTEAEEQQYRFLGKRGAKMLFIFAMSKCMESFLGEKVRDVWSLRFRDNSNFDVNVEYWKKMIKVIMPIASTHLESVVKDGLKSQEASNSAVVTVAGILAAIQEVVRTEFADIKTVINFS